MGDWRGTLKPGSAELRLVLHIAQGDDGNLKATLDSIDQGANGIAPDAYGAGRQGRMLRGTAAPQTDLTFDGTIGINASLSRCPFQASERE